jgi:hypothetical protein
MRYDYDDTSNISYRYTGITINISLDIEREIRLRIKNKLSIEEYIRNIRSNTDLIDINKALEEVINRKFPQYNCILKQ